MDLNPEIFIKFINTRRGKIDIFFNKPLETTNGYTYYLSEALLHQK